tara:strand:- start:3452 stop:3676 length:225 start_codon:yes stop_codon:yes gene_type:complete
MTTLTNNEEKAIKQGTYAFSVTGALDLQWRQVSTFNTFSEGSFTVAGDGIILLPATTLKVINGTTHSITLSKVE